MRIPKSNVDENLSSECKIAYRVGFEDGYRLGFRDGNPGRKKTDAKAEAARANGAKGGRPKKDA